MRPGSLLSFAQRWLVLLPVGAMLLWLWVMTEYRASDQRAVVRSWQSRFDEAVNLRDAGFPLGNNIWRFALDARRSFGDQERWREHIEDVNRAFGCRLEFQEFQHGVQVIVCPGTQASYTRELALLVEAMRWTDRQAQARRADYERAVNRFFGRFIPLSELQRRNGEFQMAFPQGRPVIVFIERARTGRGVAICAYDVGPKTIREYKQWKRRIRPLRKYSGFGWPDQGFWVPPPGQAERDIVQAYSGFSGESAEAVYRQGSLWFFLVEQQGRVFAFAVPYRPPDLRLPSLLLLLAIMWVWWRSRNLVRRLLDVRETEGAIVSLRLQLRLVLGAVILLPLPAGLGLAWFALQGQEERLRNQACADGLARLRVVEAGVSAMSADAQVGYTRLWQFVNQHADRIGSVTELLRPLERRGLVNHLAVLDEQHRVLFRNFNDDRNDLLMMIDNLARAGIRKFSPHRLSLEEQGRVKPIDVLMDSLCSAEELGWSQISGRPGQLLSLGVSGGRTFVYWNVFPQLSSGPAFLFGGQEPEHFLRAYITELAQADREGSAMNGVFVAHLDVLPDRSPAWNRELRTLAQLAERTRRVQQRQLTIDGRTYWVVAMIDSQTGRYALIHAYDAEKDLQSLGRLRIGILLGILPALITAWMSSLLLSELLLKPIGDLERGIEAIRARETSFRIPVRRDDEFGALADLFNRTLLELKELELAREVQGSLLPRQLPRLEGWTIGGINVTASDLGGDYYDLLAVPQSREWLMCVGDVTGHGASAALAMAMAKAGLTYRLHQGEKSLKSVLDSLNLIFYSELRSSRKYMTMVLTRFCPVSGEIELENAGHNYPLLFRRKNMAAEYVQMIGSPLGVKKKAVRDAAKLVLEAGDCVLCYTDGYPECPMPNGTLVGDDAMKAVFERLCREGLSAPKIIERLMEELQRIRQPGPLQDDVTLVVIRREEARR